MAINPKIFKTYDIRGIYPDEINEEAAEKIGAAFALYLKNKTDNVVVGRDARLSSPSLFSALTNGIVLQGLDVYDISICTTPLLIYATKKIGGDIGGVMISASHNPPEYNAFKLMGDRGVQLSKEKYAPIKEMVLIDKFRKSKRKGAIKKMTIIDNYLRHVLEFGRSIKGLKIVVDYGNGVGSITAKPAFEKLDIDMIALYEEPDGNFPNHLPDPHNVENLNELKERVKRERADLGIFFDGDADRAIIIDEKGEIVFADLLVALLAQEELKKYPREKVYYDLRFSKIVKEVIQTNGGVPVMMRVGNPFYKEKLINEGGVLAGEFSGHIMFKENYGIDDGLFAAIKTMNLMCKSDKKLSDLIEPFKKYYSTEEINIKVGDPDLVLQRIKDHFKDGHFIDLDGIYIEYPDWWFNLRKSNTEPLVRLRIEANKKELVEQKRKEILELVEYK